MKHLLQAVPLLCVVVFMAGCHKETVRGARRQPAPPTRRPATGSDNSRASIPPVRPVPGYDPEPDSDFPSNARVLSTETGLASWYGPPYHNRNAANGLPYDQNAMTAAHRTLPMGTVVRVTNLATAQSAVVKITDRGPFVQGRVLDLSMAAAKQTGLYRMGVGKVRIDVLQNTPNAALSGKWCVQVGAFLKEGNAQRLKSDMQRRFATAKVIEFPGPTGHWVRINPAVMDKAHATQVADSIRPAEPDAQAYLVRLD